MKTHDEKAARDEALTALDYGRVIEASPLGIGFVLIAPNPLMNKWVAKGVVFGMIRDGLVTLEEDGPRTVLKITQQGRNVVNFGTPDLPAHQEIGESGA